mmetsp:Transcript_7625/g.8388  ORF Transcript_7625/g.8388 Transcript_7625/m.8388 type:complete len:651 (+) Transcript_7625:229-2181(+)
MITAKKIDKVKKSNKCLRFKALLLHCISFASILLATKATQNDNVEANITDGPCMDRDPSCKAWLQVAECRKEASFKYMKENCPFSCGYCNPMLQKWAPVDSDSGEDSSTYLTQKYDMIPINYGVPQKTDFGDSPFIQNTTAVKDGLFKGSEYFKLRVADVIESMHSYLDYLYCDEIANVNSNGEKVDVRTKHTTVIEFSPVDVEGAPIGAHLPLPETCVNRHPNCALWAALGYCDSSKKLMQQLCSPMCHSCQHTFSTSKVVIQGAQGDHQYIKVVHEEDIWAETPYERKDLYGLLDRIQERRIIVQDPQFSDNYGEYFPPNMSIEKRNAGLINEACYLNTKEMEFTSFRVVRKRNENKLYKDMLKSNGTGTAMSYIISIKKLLNAEDCQGLLDTVSFGVGVYTDNHDDTGEDGFPSPTVDVIRRNGEEIVMRNSSRVFVNPSIRENTGVMRYSNSIERLLIKIKWLIGMDAVDHIEAPIIFEKFEEGNFQSVTSHFKSGILHREKDLFDEEIIKIKYGDQYVDLSDDDRCCIPDTMENARIFGLTVHLSDVEEGGRLYFPKLAKAKVKPEMGNAILFPTVASLIELPNDRDDGVEALDADLDHEGSDSSYMVEDISTIFGHQKMIGSTPKYSVTLYFRRYEDEDRLEDD